MLQAIQGMKNGKAPGPDSFPAEFYKKCWHIIKKDLLAMFHDLFSGHLQLFHLNFGTIALLPKKEGASRIEQFRPIFLLNVSFKIFTKVGTDRITKMAHSVVQSSQTAFMPGRNILEGLSYCMRSFMNCTPRSSMEFYLRLILKRHTTKSNGLSSNKLSV